MSKEIIEQILEMQNYSVKEVIITEKQILFRCEKKEPIYCCPRCHQQSFSDYDFTHRLIEDLPMSGKRVFIELPIRQLADLSASRRIWAKCQRQKPDTRLLGEVATLYSFISFKKLVSQYS